MKIFKRNAVIITVLLFVCAAVYLNWSYNETERDADALIGGNEAENVTNGDSESPDILSGDEGTQNESDAGLYYASETGSQHSEKFAEVRLNRQQARDSAAETLKTVTETEAASQEMIDEAAGQIMTLAEWTVKEAELESMILSKGFSDCVVYISEEGITVTVAASQEGLSSADVAKIADIITSETDFTMQELTVVEIK